MLVSLANISLCPLRPEELSHRGHGDALGRVITFPSTLSESYTYDAMNNLLTKTDRKLQTISYGGACPERSRRNALYRLTSKTLPNSRAVNYSYDLLSRLTQVTAPSGTYTFSYDNLGRRTSLTRPNGVVAQTSAFEVCGSSLSSRYRIGGEQRSEIFRRKSRGPQNRRSALRSFSRRLGVLGGYLPGSAGYTYDAAGNRTSKTAVQQANPNPVSVTSNYSYDYIYELTQAVVGGNLAEGYTYDAVGNRLTSAGPTSYNYNASNELTSTSAATYTYDNNGNTLSKTDTTGTTYYTWDFENRLTSVTLPGTGGTVNFNYDPLGRRIRKVYGSATTIYAYDGANMIEELGGGGNLLAHYTQGAGIDEPLAIYQGLTHILLSTRTAWAL